MDPRAALPVGKYNEGAGSRVRASAVPVVEARAHPHWNNATTPARRPVNSLPHLRLRQVVAWQSPTLSQ